MSHDRARAVEGYLAHAARVAGLPAHVPVMIHRDHRLAVTRVCFGRLTVAEVTELQTLEAVAVHLDAEGAVEGWRIYDAMRAHLAAQGRA